MSQTRDRGVALVAATMAIAMLTVVAVGLAVTATTGDRVAANALAITQAEALARSGVAAARAALAEASAADVPDTLRSAWAQPFEPQVLGTGTVRVRVEDEARRLDLNALPDALPALLGRLGLDPLLADAIRDWTDADDLARPHGAERAWYRSQRPARDAANRPLASVGELLLVRGIDARALERLRPFVTTAGEDGVNPNTAPPDVLFAVWFDPTRVGELLAARTRGPVECGDLPHCTTRSTTYTIRATGSVGAAERMVEAKVRVLAGVDAEVVGWRWAAVTE
ncbi:MAG: type II secretion system minor pseudopilin GspK [Candidatus Binatia bacterium]